MLLDSKTGENQYTIGLYCQSCCYHYPDECNNLDVLHPYDRFAEICPDFVPKDYYKALSRAKCWKKRLSIDPGFELQSEDVRYYKIVTKQKALNFCRNRKNVGERNMKKTEIEKMENEAPCKRTGKFNRKKYTACLKQYLNEGEMETKKEAVRKTEGSEK